MTEETKESIFKGVDLHPKVNNFVHHTSEISLDQLIVRRGQPFKVTINLSQPFNQNLYPLAICAATGKHPTEEQGTLSFFSLPGLKKPSPSAKAVWKVELHKDASPPTGLLVLTITPPADTPIGEFNLVVKHRDEEKTLPTLVVLYNPWCSDDWVYMKEEKEINEYVMNEKGIIYKGSSNYIFPFDWDFGQFEDKMVDICLKILDVNHKHIIDPADDVSARCNPIYVGRVISAMINCQDDSGVLMGCWDGSYRHGFRPSHWTGSHAILKRWLNYDCQRVKYGQCWVFAGVMCSVMRLLGIPCRVVTNYQSAHDINKNLSIDVYHADYGVREKPSYESVWNFHVWVEAWMRRPDLAEDGQYDGWQVLDPTPQARSDGVYCCGPAPVTAVRSGQTDLKYDIPFVFAEVNADCNDWLVKADGSMVKVYSDTWHVGQNISTKRVGSDKRNNITDNYKAREGSMEERYYYEYATTRDYSRALDEIDEYMYGDENEEMEEHDDEEIVENIEVEEIVESIEVEEIVESIEVEEIVESIEVEDIVENIEVEEMEETDEEDESADVVENRTLESLDNVSVSPAQPTVPTQVSMRFEEVTPPINGKDVRLKLVLQSKSTAARPLSINIRVQAMRYNGELGVNIQNEVKEKTLQPWIDLVIPIRIPFSDYRKPMLECDSIKVSAVVMDKEKPDYSYLAQDDVVLLPPHLAVKFLKAARVNRRVIVEVIFKNPVNETLTQCSLTLSGSGLLHDEVELKIPDLKKNNRIRVQFPLIPYKIGKKTLVADFDCSTFRDIKSSCTVDVKPSI
ncbi:protein-glutamine gamma-glutamyltransferase 2-like [Cebidichthys violaceus]|uniref:protein-glutamine gamma-glutamyltransferase 2-like n=1 Tax=Cebidichthys violaceus TaxID=271503 RepID=UPI0035CADC5F